MRRPILLSVALLVGCSFPVDEFKAASSEGEQTQTPPSTESPIVGKCDGLPTPNREVAGRCYFAAAGGKHNFDAAVRACAAVRGAHLVTVGASEHSTVTALAQQLSTEVWIGLRAADDEGVFRWITGESDPFRAWRDDYPKEDGGLCVMAKKDGRWENRKCDDEYVALCEL